MSMPMTITPELVRKHGLSTDEYERIKQILGREPNYTELGVFSVMWSEHCSYKNTRLQLKKFPTTGPRVLVKAGEENAGVIDIGDGWAVALKMESHNHPSAIEPFNGAATGVGGILRDVFAVGARPIAVLDSLRFGEPGRSERSRYLLERAFPDLAIVDLGLPDGDGLELLTHVRRADRVAGEPFGVAGAVEAFVVKRSDRS